MTTLILLSLPHLSTCLLHTLIFSFEKNKTEKRNKHQPINHSQQAVTDQERLDMYRLYIRKAEAYFGVTRTREIHERALSALGDKDAQLIALDYANLEKKLGTFFFFRQDMRP
jgi:pre-mRNA-splicing factor SYF1